MTNRQWLIWQLIDMSDEEFNDRICGNRDFWLCTDCVKYGVNDHDCDGCENVLYEWLKQEHKEG